MNKRVRLYTCSQKLTKFKGLETFSQTGVSMIEEVLRLKGKAADAFLEYDSRKLSKKERAENKEAYEYYIQHKLWRESCRTCDGNIQKEMR